MKRTSLLLLCLFLISCKRQEPAENLAEACPLSMTIPVTEAHFRLGSPGKKYLYELEGEILWDDCANDSYFNVYETQFLPGYGGVKAKKIVRGMLYPLHNPIVNLRVFELDNSCQASASPVFDEAIVPREQMHTYGVGACAFETAHHFLDAEIN